MSGTQLNGTCTLTPIAAVDTSSASSGVSMFTLLFDSEFLDNRNVIQFEYWVSEVDVPLPALLNGFIPLEDAVTTQGISNQCTIAIPSSNNEYEPSIPVEVKVRVYFGETTANPEINVSQWSNTCPLHNAPPQPSTPSAYLARGEYPPTYDVNDVLYVQIPDNPAYLSGEIDFVVSYSYTDSNNQPQWIVTPPLGNWTRHIFTNLSQNAILLPEIVLNPDVSYSSPIYVAVNAVFNYNYSGNYYFSVSEISTTVQATDAVLTSPTLNPIEIPNDYLVYSQPSTQEIELSWIPPSNSLLPNFTVDSYIIQMSVGGVVVDTISGILASTLDYTYTIPAEYVNASTTTTLQFNVVAVFSTGQSAVSNSQFVNTFKYATAPQTLIVNWANSGSTQSNVDIALQFYNPSSNGFGSVINFVVNVINADTIAYSQNVPYVPGNAPYSVYIIDIAAANVGSVEVYMVTQDTNPQTVGGLYVSQNGASAAANYLADDLPKMLSYNRTPTELTSSWVSTTQLDSICIFNYWDTTNQQLESIQYTTIPGTYQGYSVVQQSLPSADILYNFTFGSSFFPDGVIPPHLGQSVANGYGIKFERVRVPIT